MKRIHIVGLGPRTGTTLLAQSMVACFHIDHHETHERSLLRHRRTAGTYLTKEPGELAVVGPRLFVDPHLFVIGMVRDPRDVIVSRHREDPDRFWAPLSIWKRDAAFVRQLQGHSRFIPVRYEHLVTEPDSVQAVLAARMPFLVRRARFSEFEKFAAPSEKAIAALGGLRPMDPHSIGSWRRHLPRVAGQIAQHGPITKDLIEFGYEQDGGWTTLLAGIEPDLTPSHWPEQRSRPSWKRRRKRYIEAAKIALIRCLGIQKV